MTSYKELGLVNTREMFAKAVAGGYAIPAFNFNTMEQMQAIVFMMNNPFFGCRRFSFTVSLIFL